MNSQLRGEKGEKGKGRMVVKIVLFYPLYAVNRSVRLSFVSSCVVVKSKGSRGAGDGRSPKKKKWKLRVAS